MAGGADRACRPRLSLNHRMPSQQSADAKIAAATVRRGIVTQKYWYIEKTAPPQALTIWTPIDAAATPRMAANSTRLDSMENSTAQRNISRPKKPKTISTPSGLNPCSG